MNGAAFPARVIETADERVLGAFQFVDAVTGLPITTPAALEARGATVAGAPLAAPLDERTLRIRRNRRGVCLVMRAPFFESYANTFDDPAVPPDTQAGPLRLRIAATDVGAQYLPQEFQFDLPRSLDPAAADSVFIAQPIGLLRAPSAPVQDGWALLRVLVTQTGVSPAHRLPGVLIRVFRAPRAPSDVPIGLGMTDWRGGVRGEALVPVAGVQRFRPGAGDSVIETDQPIELDATRDSGFTGAAGQVPDVTRLIAGTDQGIIRPPDLPPQSVLHVVRPTPPLRVRAGREDVVELTMP